MTCDNGNSWTINGQKVSNITCNVLCLSCQVSQISLERGEVTPILNNVSNSFECSKKNAVCNGTKQGIAIQVND